MPFEITDEEIAVGIGYIQIRFNVELDPNDLRRVMDEVQEIRKRDRLEVPAAIDDAIYECGIIDPARKKFVKKAAGHIFYFRRQKYQKKKSSPAAQAKIINGLEGRQLTFAIMPKRRKSKPRKKVASR